tara:strand:+ start:1161 stop:1340 length:180 start_codon:yes stop_codon:yes gene_type:complete
MVKKYKLKKDLMPSKPSFLKLGKRNWYDLNSGKTVELNKVSDLAKDYLEQVKVKIKEAK